MEGIDAIVLGAGKIPSGTPHAVLVICIKEKHIIMQLVEKYVAEMRESVKFGELGIVRWWPRGTFLPVRKGKKGECCGAGAI